jgi:hypothetical protein
VYGVGVRVASLRRRVDGCGLMVVGLWFRVDDSGLLSGGIDGFGLMVPI